MATAASRRRQPLSPHFIRDLSLQMVNSSAQNDCRHILGMLHAWTVENICRRRGLRAARFIIFPLKRYALYAFD